MNAAALLQELSSSGVEIRSNGDRIFVRPRARASAEQKEALLRHKAEVIQLLKCPSPQAAPESEQVRVFSRLLGEEVWIADSDESAAELESELAKSGDRRLVFTAAEVVLLEGMLAADLAALMQLKRAFPGARLRGVRRPGEESQG